MTHPVDNGFLRQGKDYHTLICYQKAKCYLRVNHLEQWAMNSPKAIQTRNYCRRHNDPKDYSDKITTRSAETICNIAITLILQTDVLIKGLIEWQKQHFKANGGIKEQMYKERVKTFKRP